MVIYLKILPILIGIKCLKENRLLVMFINPPVLIVTKIYFLHNYLSKAKMHICIMIRILMR